MEIIPTDSISRESENLLSASAHVYNRSADDGIRALVIDDNDNVRKILSTTLSDMEIEVAGAQDGQEGLTLFKECTFDIVLTDLNMPRMDGLSMAKHIKALSPHTPIILLTGENISHQMLQGGHVDTVLLKPFRLEVIKKIIHNILNKKNNRKERRINSLL